MKEYISKEAAIDDIKKIYCPQCDSYNGVMCRACEHMDDMIIIEDMPAADVQPANKWISIHDRLPEIGENVLIYYPYWKSDEIHVARLDCDCLTFDVCGEFNINVNSVTHWMPLPDSPVIPIKGGDHT